MVPSAQPVFVLEEAWAPSFIRAQPLKRGCNYRLASPRQAGLHSSSLQRGKRHFPLELRVGPDEEFLAVSRKISFPDDFFPLLPRLIKGILGL